MGSWEKVTDDEGNEYYYNSETQETSWTNPEVDQSDWQEFSTEDGQKYYYNVKTEETTWDKPEGFGDDKKAEEVAENELDKEIESKPVIADIQSAEEDQVTAEDAFTQLLKQNEVDSTWSFQDVMAKFIDSPIYWKIEDPSQRKQLYDEYLMNETKRNLVNKSDILAQFKHNFIPVLEGFKENKELDHLTRWISIKNRLVKEDNPIFKHTLLSDGEIYLVFKAYQDQLKQEHEIESKQLKEQAMVELESYLTKINTGIVSENEDWDSLYDSLLKDNRFKANKHFNSLHKSDILELYVDKILAKQIEDLEDQVEKVQKTNYRYDRKARDNFKALLRELPLNDIILDENFEFKTVLPYIEDEDAFIDICGRNGSSAAELVLDLLTEHYQLLKVKADVIETVLLSLESETDIKLLLEDPEAFITKIITIEDERVEGIKDSDPQELENIQGMIKKSFQQRAQKHKEEVYKDLKAAKKALSHWMLNNYQTNSIFSVVELDEKKSTSICILHKDKDYSILASDLTRLKDDLSSVKEFSRLLELTESLSTYEETSLDVTLQDILDDFIHLVNAAPKKNKRQAEFEDSDRKRPAKARVLLNY